ncbi:MAG: Gfo/Idh/MocA family oxidoreductase [Anaerolineae bacterium]|nr:Gfo/Idh/MocA family oxidoreductase [Anaerolineae bacterium]
MINVGVIGYGYWGPNLVRNFSESTSTQVVAVSDLNPERLALVQRRYPTIRTTLDHRELWADSNIDAIAIATPVTSHFDLGMGSLKAGKHVLIEKPLTESYEQAQLLVEEAEKRDLVLMVDHTFVYTGAIRKMKELVTTGELGKIYYYDSVRVNLGLFQHDVNVIWDLAVHDLSIMEHILPSHPIAVSATGVSHIEGQPENIAYITLFFEDNLIAHVHVNWLAPVKVRSTLIGGSKKMIVYDDLQPSEKVKVYNKGITLNNNDNESRYQMLIGYRTGDMWAPHLDMTEALQREVKHFADCIENGALPITNGQSGLRVVQILEAATQSMMNRGEPVELNTMRIPA